MRFKTFLAEYAFRCALCDGTHSQGTPASYEDNYLAADECRDDPELAIGPHHLPSGNGRSISADIQTMPHGKTKSDRCDRCFIIHATGQEECY